MSPRPNDPICAFGFHIGNVIEIDGEECRISGPNPDGSVTFVSYRSGRHIPLTRDEFMTKLDAGAIVINRPNSLRPGSGNSLRAALLTTTAAGVPLFEIAAYKNEFVRAVIAIPLGQRKKRLTDGLIAQIHDEYLKKWQYPKWLIETTPPAISTVYKWLRAAEYRANVGLLVPAFNLRGTRGSRLHPLIEDWIVELSETFYFNAPEAQLSSAAESIRTEIADRIAHKPLLMGFRAPSKATILRRIASLGGERRLEHEEGKRAARLAYKQVMLGPDLLYPMARWEIDHTKIDVIVVDNEGNQILGRVWLTCIIDHKTRMIAGYILDSQAPDAASVLAALRFAILPKTRALLDALGVRSEWPLAGPSRELATDRGRDFLSWSVMRALQAMGIDLVMMPPRTPQSKGRIERFFGTLNSLLFHQLAGTTKSNPAAKGDRQPEQEARVTFAELNSLIARTICDVYHNKWHSALRCTPLQMWQRLTDKFPVPEIKSGPEVREATMMSYVGIATRSGIKIEGTRYGSADVSRLRSQCHAHYRGNPKVNVLLDPEDISKIHVRDPKSGQVIEIPALDAANLQGVSLRMHRLVMAKMKAENLEATPTNYASCHAGLMADVRRINRRKRKTGAPKDASAASANSHQGASSSEGPAATDATKPSVNRPDRKTSKPSKQAESGPIPKFNKFNLDE
jgi:transposase InsO family protein